jgi:hypothetical protein
MQRIGLYAIVAQIGAGACGRVFRARRDGADRDVALKLLDPQLVGDADATYRFAREARLASALAHPRLVPVLDAGDDRGAPYIAMELVEGTTLEQRLASGALPWEEAVRIAAGILEGLQALHAAGIVHRDVKPSNVLLDAKGEPRLTDFGLALTADSTRITKTGAFIGTLRYIAPEIMTGEPATAASDLWSTGFVLYRMLTGRNALDAPTSGEFVQVLLSAQIQPPTAHVPDLPAALSEVAMSLLVRSPSRRAGPAIAVRDRLLACLARPSRAPRRERPPSAPAAPARPLRSVRVPPIALTGALLAATAFALWPRPRPAPPVPSISARAPAPAPDLTAWRARLDRIEAADDTRVARMSELMMLIQPAARHYVQARRILRLAIAEDDLDVAETDAIVKDLGIALPPPEAMTLPQLLVTTRASVAAARAWCGRDNAQTLDAILAPLGKSDPGLERGIEIADALNQRPFRAGAAQRLLASFDLIDISARRLAQAPDDSGPDLAAFLLSVRAVAYWVPFRPWIDTDRPRIDRRVAALHRDLGAIKEGCPGAIAQLTLALFDHALARKPLAAQEQLEKSLARLLATTPCLTAAREISATLRTRLLAKSR